MMKLIVLGAGGSSGRRLVAGGVARGHAVTAFVRDAGRFGPPPPGVRVVVGDVRDAATLAAAVAGHDAVVNAAGTLFDDDFVALVGEVVATVAATLGADGRLWLYGGAAILPVAGTPHLGVDLPFVPKVYRRHRINFDRVAATALDWSMACPGPMNPAADGAARSDLRITREAWPVAHRPASRLALTLAVARDRPALVVTYEDVAATILDHLDRGGRFGRSRVGFALPPGERATKLAA